MGMLMKRKPLKFQPAPVSFWAEMFGDENPEWPLFVRELRGKSGVYIIRDRETKDVLYVGESHTGRLKKTLLRHFQAWSGKTAGPTFSRNSVEIAVEVTSEANAVPRQNKLIADLRPTLNRINPDGAELDEPF